MAKFGSATEGQIWDEKENYHTCYCKNQISRGLEQIEVLVRDTNKFTFDIYW
jgi:hypothetical protein